MEKTLTKKTKEMFIKWANNTNLEKTTPFDVFEAGFKAGSKQTAKEIFKEIEDVHTISNDCDIFIMLKNWEELKKKFK